MLSSTSLAIFQKKISPAEKNHFLSLLKQYQSEKVPLIAILELLKSLILRFDVAYLINQRYFHPYPEQLYQ